MAHETAGDPVTGLKWTRRTTAKVAAELHRLGIDVCPRTVARLLKAMGFSLRVNHKKLAGASHPDRNDQFERITALRKRCAAENIPVISVDTKKKELVGAFRNPGAKWDHTPRTRQGPRLSLRGRRHRHPLRHLRPAGEHRHRIRRRERRHPGVRRRLHREVVAHRGPQALSPRRGAADPRRQRRQQRLLAAGLEVQPATSALQPSRPAGDRGPLPDGRVEVESHRTPSVLRNQQELVRPPSGQLRDHPEIPAHHTHDARTARTRAHRDKSLRDRRQDHRRRDAGATHHTEQLLAQMELHHRTLVTKTGTYFCADPNSPWKKSIRCNVVPVVWTTRGLG